MKNYFAILFLILFLISPLAHATSEFESAYDHAKTSYYSGQYDEAARIFLSLAQDRGDNADLYYNLGNVSFKQGHLGQAVLYYEKALKLAPRSHDLRANLKLVRAQMTTDTGESFSDYLLKTFYFWNAFLNFGEFQILFLSFTFLFWGYVAWRLLTHRSLVSTSTVLALLAFAYLGFGAFLKFDKDHWARYGIVLSTKVEAKASYLEKEQPIFFLGEGDKVRIIDEQRFGDNQHWLRVALPQGQTGWVAAETIGVI
jgi:tetratricopeptide (TPR) repeat protein